MKQKLKDHVVINKTNLIKLLTKCAKMTEEGGDLIRNGINGASAGSLRQTQTLGTSAGLTGQHQQQRSLSTKNNNLHGFHKKQSSSSSCAGVTSAGGNGESVGTNLVLQKTKGLSASDSDNNRTQNSGSVTTTSSTTLLQSGTGGTSNDRANCNPGNITATGGRLQFFKDGKFILELARAREGDRTGWVSVPRKTYWPPTAAPTPVTATYPLKNESSTSLSFSDDNSSIQSSPWQRDHCWKQTTPRRNASKEMDFYFFRSAKCVVTFENTRNVKLKKRRPYDQSLVKLEIFSVKLENGIKQEIKEELDAELNVDDIKASPNSAESVDAVDGDTKKRIDRDGGRSSKLNKIVEKILERKKSMAALVVPPSSKSVSLHHSKIDGSHHLQHVSPRKRILREFERVSLEDSTTMKRSRPKVTTAISNGNNTTSSSTSTSTLVSPSVATISQEHSKCANGDVAAIVTQPVSRPISSYSITSLLGHNSVKSESSSSTSQPLQSGIVSDPSHLRARLTSPQSPEYRHPKYGFEKKKSPSYSSPQQNLSPKLGGGMQLHYANHCKSPSTNESYSIVRSPGLSPSPEHHQGYRFRGHPSTSSSSPNYHPYMSSSSASRCSPSGTLSPTSDLYNSRYRPGYLIGSPNHSSSFNSTRHSPNSHYNQSKPYNNKMMSSPTHHLNNLNITVNKIREGSSPSVSPSLEQINRETTPTSLSSTSGSSAATTVTGSNRTVPKKTAAFRQHQFTNNMSVSSPNINVATLDSYYKSAKEHERERDREKKSPTMKYERDDRRRTPSDNSSLNNHPMPLLSSSSSAADELDLRPPPPHSQIPSPSLYQQPHGMYYLHPSYHNPSSVSPFLPYCHPLSYASAVSAAYRNSLWMHYPPLSAVAASSAAAGRISSMMSYGAGPGGLLDPSQTTSASGSITSPWCHPSSSLSADPVALVRIKDESSSDVPLNLSKH